MIRDLQKKLSQTYQKQWAHAPTRYFLITVYSVIGLAFAFYLGSHMMSDVDPEPCAPGGFPGRCYYVQQNTCEYFWSRAEKNCKDTVRKLSLPLTRLITPIVTKCQLSSMDKAFPRVETDECLKLHKDLEGWRMRNPDFK